MNEKSQREWFRAVVEEKFRNAYNLGGLSEDRLLFVVDIVMAAYDETTATPETGEE